MSTLNSAIARDTTANRPAAGIPGRLFFATDTLKIWRDNGTSWDDVTPPGATVPTWVSKSPDTPPASATSYDDEFEAASLNTSLWTWFNQASAASAQSMSHLALYDATGADYSDSIRGITQPILAGDQTGNYIFAAGPFSFAYYQSSTTYGGMCLRDGSGNFVDMMLAVQASTGSYPFNLGVYGHTSSYAYGGRHPYGTPATPCGSPVRYLAMQKSGTNLNYLASPDGIFWNQVYSEAVSTALAGGNPVSVGFLFDVYGGHQQVNVDWFRKLSSVTVV